jgi:glycosyltransferase involved in cell wall biosynthesis
MEQTSFLLTHHANLSTIAVHEANQSWQKPYGVFAHGTGIEGYILARRRDVLWDMLLAALNHVTAIFVTSEYVKQALLAPYISAEALENVVVIPLPVDMRLEQRGEDREKLGQAFLQLMEGVSQPYILYVGALLDSKGAMALAHASGVYSTHAQTIFAGDGALRRMLTQQGQRCIETGYVTEEEKAYLMKNAYLIAVPSLKKEHFGLTVIEAMISGTPPIAYRQGGIPEIIQENQTGFFVDHVTSDDLGQKILWLLEHPEVVEQARRQVKAYALNKYSWQNTGARFIMKVQDLLRSEVSVPV